MHIVSLGFALPNPQVDNHSIANAPSLFEYDACFIDPRVVSTQIEEIIAGTGQFQTSAGAPLQAGATGVFHHGLGELISQRRDELQRLIDRGGLIVVLGYPNVPHPGVTTLPGADRFSILPAAPGVVYRPPQLVPGDGRTIQSLEPAHPWSVYLSEMQGKLRYQAHWNLEAIPDSGATAQVFARSKGGAAVGVDFKIGPGRLVMIPPPAGEVLGRTRRPLIDAIIESVQRTLEDRGDEVSPNWLRRFDLPGLAPALEEVEAAQQSFAEAESRLVEARAHATDASKYHGLLWRAGHYSLEPLVRDAFRELGFTVPTDLTRSAELRDGDQIALLEIDASNGSVAESAYLALQRRIEADFLRSGERRKGIIVVNGERLSDPGARKQPFSETLRNACDNFGYALITGDALFALVSYALERREDESSGPDAELLAEIRATILETDGLLSVEENDDEATPLEPEESDAGEAEKPVEAATSSDEGPDT